MVDQYVYAVTKKVPEKSRNEVANELRALIERNTANMDDTLTEEEKVCQVLLELGDPREVAKRYKGKERYLIGPAYFDTYLYVLKIVVFAIMIAITVGSALSILFSENDFGSIIGGYIASLITSVLQGAAWVTGIFAFIEYREISIDVGKDWDPSKLPPLPEEKAVIKRSETAFSIIFTAIFLALFVFVPELVGIYHKTDDGSAFINLFQLDAYIPFKTIIFLAFVLSICGDLLKISKGVWTLKIAIAVTFFNIASATLSIYVITKEQIWNAGIVAAFDNYGPFTFDRLILLVIVSIIAITIIESVIALYKAVKYKAR